MSKHNYSQYYSKKNVNANADSVVVEKSTLVPAELNDVNAIETHEVKMEAEAVETVGTPNMPELTREAAETIISPKTTKGIVANCAKLNVRAYPSRDADIVCVLDVTSEVEIYTDKSTYDWVCVCTVSGVEGYCMKKFVDTDL